MQLHHFLVNWLYVAVTVNSSFSHTAILCTYVVHLTSSPDSLLHRHLSECSPAHLPEQASSARHLDCNGCAATHVKQPRILI